MSTRLWLPIAFSLFACGVDPIDVDVCGNNVVEATEDCDSRPRPEHADQAVTCAAPGAANECRYTCDRAAAVAGCPAGWECGEDNLCRHASGQYSTGIGNSAIGELAVGKVDSDDKADVLVNAIDEVHALFSAGDGSFATGRIVPAVSLTPLPDAGDLDGDGRVDVITGTLSGFIQAQGQSTRTFLPFAQPTFPVSAPFASRSLPIQVTSASASPREPNQHLFVLDEEIGTLRLRVVDQFVTDASGNLVDEIAPVDLAQATLADVAGTPQRVDVDGDGDQEILIVVIGATTAKLVSVVSDGRFVTALTITNIVLPRPADGNGGRFADVDGNGRLDLVIGVDDGGTSRVAVAPGLGGLSFGSAAIDPFFDTMDDTVFNLDGNAFAFTPIDLGGGKPGWINNVGIFRNAGGAPFLVDFNPTFFWVEAVVGDFNNDGLQDMAATTGKSGLDVFLQTEAHLFAHTRVATAKTPSNLRVGDFDGDGTADLAFRESIVANIGPYALSASFGSSQGLTTVVSLGEWDDVTSLEPMSILLEATKFRDGIDDLLVQGVIDPAAATDSLTFLFGSYQRVMLAPYEVKSEDPGRFLTGTVFPSHAIIGRFDGDDTPDVMTLDRAFDVGGSVEKLFFGLARGTGRGNLESPAQSLGAIDLPGAIGFGCSQFVAADLDGSGRDDIAGVIQGNCTADMNPVLVFAIIDGGSVNVTTIPLTSQSPFVRVRAADVDGDGKREILTTGFGESAIYFHDGGASFTRVSAPDDGGEALALAVLNADDDPAPELVVANDAGVSTYEVADRTFTSRRTIVDGFFGNVALTADLNGDRLDDLIVQDEGAGTFHVFFAIPQDAVLR